MKNIPLHLLQDRTQLGLQLQYFKKGVLPTEETDLLSAHRDDHYMFFILEKGSGSLMIDFNEMQLSANMFYYVLPTQVHTRMRTEMAAGWFLAVDTSLIPPECRNAFENRLLLQQPYTMNEIQLRQCFNLLILLHEKIEDDDTNPFYITVIHTLLQSFLAITAGCYNEHTSTDLRISRLAQLSNQFKKLLIIELRTVKSPRVYAGLLNVSEIYLNEALKKTTGFSVIYWIQQEVMMEAKRLLYYSQLTVKEIAHNLGYNDHSYFSRLFRKVTGISALAFREQYRK